MAKDGWPLFPTLATGIRRLPPASASADFGHGWGRSRHSLHDRWEFSAIGDHADHAATDKHFELFSEWLDAA